VLRHQLFVVLLTAGSLFPQTKTEPAPQTEIPVISGDQGACSADFTVISTTGKPLYKAKLTVEIRYGFGGFRRTSLEIYTNVDGKARVKGLPEKGKRPLLFDVTYEGRATTVVVDTQQKCNGNYSAIVSDKAVASDSQ
jgi:hypothetical protein